jgi:hypothetical protein
MAAAPRPSGPIAALATLAALPGAAVGAVLGAGFGVAARVRRNKPLHPAGTVGTAVLDVTTPAPHLGVPLLAGAGEHDCLVRWSRSAGVPSPLPDVEGFALRVLDAGGAGPADLLFASAGEGTLGRHTLLLRRPRSHGPLSTLLPVVGPTGSLMFLVEPLDDEDPPQLWRLLVADAGSDWRSVATVSVAGGNDQGVRFDPVENQLPGTRQYPLVRVLREPAYAMARLGSAARPS